MDFPAVVDGTAQPTGPRLKGRTGTVAVLRRKARGFLRGPGAGTAAAPVRRPSPPRPPRPHDLARPRLGLRHGLEHVLGPQHLFKADAEELEEVPARACPQQQQQRPLPPALVMELLEGVQAGRVDVCPRGRRRPRCAGPPPRAGRPPVWGRAGARRRESKAGALGGRPLASEMMGSQLPSRAPRAAPDYPAPDRGPRGPGPPGPNSRRPQVGDTGLEPVTSCVSCMRASQLRQSPARPSISRQGRGLFSPPRPGSRSPRAGSATCCPWGWPARTRPRTPATRSGPCSPGTAPPPGPAAR